MGWASSQRRTNAKKLFRKGDISISVSKYQEENFISTPKPIFKNFILHKYTINTKYFVMKAKNASFFVCMTNVFMHYILLLLSLGFNYNFFMHFLLSLILYFIIIIRRVFCYIMIFWYLLWLFLLWSTWSCIQKIN